MKKNSLPQATRQICPPTAAPARVRAGTLLVLWVWQDFFVQFAVRTIPYCQFKAHLEWCEVVEATISRMKSWADCTASHWLRTEREAFELHLVEGVEPDKMAQELGVSQARAEELTRAVQQHLCDPVGGTLWV